MIDDERPFSIDTLAEYSGLSASSIRRYIAAPVNPLPAHHVHVGGQRGRVLIYKREFDAWVKAFPPPGPEPSPGKPRRDMADRVAAAVKSMR